MKTPGGVRGYERDVFIAGYMAGIIDGPEGSIEEHAQEAYRQWRLVRDMIELGHKIDD